MKKIDEFSKKSAGESQGVSAVGGGQIPRIISLTAIQQGLSQCYLG
ncbi:MAG TPA: hypothetical protein VN379_00280 [Sporomusa sp.]|nr:hypothetical protein [Sporomusa sp.]